MPLFTSSGLTYSFPTHEFDNHAQLVKLDIDQIKPFVAELLDGRHLLIESLRNDTHREATAEEIAALTVVKAHLETEYEPEPMTEARARKILGSICDGTTGAKFAGALRLLERGRFVSWPQAGEGTLAANQIRLDGAFTPDYLEALAFWMRTIAWSRRMAMPEELIDEPKLDEPLPNLEVRKDVAGAVVAGISESFAKAISRGQRVTGMLAHGVHSAKPFPVDGDTSYPDYALGIFFIIEPANGGRITPEAVEAGFSLLDMAERAENERVISTESGHARAVRDDGAVTQPAPGGSEA